MKNIILTVGDGGLSAFRSDCVNVVGDFNNLYRLASSVCPLFGCVRVCGVIEELWFYNGVMIFRDCDDYLCYVVPVLCNRTCRFSSLRAAKSAITRRYGKP